MTLRYSLPTCPSVCRNPSRNDEDDYYSLIWIPDRATMTAGWVMNSSNRYADYDHVDSKFDLLGAWITGQPDIALNVTFDQARWETHRNPDNRFFNGVVGIERGVQYRSITVAIQCTLRACKGTVLQYIHERNLRWVFSGKMSLFDSEDWSADQLGGFGHWCPQLGSYTTTVHPVDIKDEPVTHPVDVMMANEDEVSEDSDGEDSDVDLESDEDSSESEEEGFTLPRPFMPRRTQGHSPDTSAPPLTCNCRCCWTQGLSPDTSGLRRSKRSNKGIPYEWK